MSEEKRMKVPDPEDPKYWHNFMKYDASGKAYGILSFFDEKKYIKDFREWKSGLKQMLSEASKAEILKHNKLSSVSEIISHACYTATCRIIKLILGEEVSEG